MSQGMLQPHMLSRTAPVTRIAGECCKPSRMAYIVTDAKQLVAYVSGMIGGAGIQMKWFQSASGYLGYKRPAVPSCLLISRRISDMSGLDVQRKLAPTMCPPIIFLSDDGDISLCVRAIKEGAHDFLKIPLITSQLLETMEAAFNKDRAAIAMRQKDEDLLRRWRSLTRREAEVMRYAVAGFLNKQTAGELGIAENTVQVHRGRVMRKMCADSFAALVRMSLRLADRGEYSHLHAAADPTQENRPLVV
jgi:FixJ family two-component response regulator